MAKDRTLLAFISEVRGRAAISRLRASSGDQFVNSALIRDRLASGISFSDCSREEEPHREKYKMRTGGYVARETSFLRSSSFVSCLAETSSTRSRHRFM